MSIDRIELARQFRAGVKAFASGATTITDAQALSMATLFPVWPEGVNGDGEYIQNQIVQDEGVLYRIVPEKVTPLESQPPHGEGMLAVYRPIDVEHAGTLGDPIPFVYGMDTEKDKYYSYKGQIYLCNAEMPACVFAPDTEGLWQWEIVG